MCIYRVSRPSALNIVRLTADGFSMKSLLPLPTHNNHVETSSFSPHCPLTNLSARVLPHSRIQSRRPNGAKAADTHADIDAIALIADPNKRRVTRAKRTANLLKAAGQLAGRVGSTIRSAVPVCHTDKISHT